MTKSGLTCLLRETCKLPKRQAEQIVDAIFDAIQDSLRAGQRVEIRGFGSFELRRYRGYEGRNPRTGEAVVVGPKHLPCFRAGREMKDRINAQGQTGSQGLHATLPAARPKRATPRPAAPDLVAAVR